MKTQAMDFPNNHLSDVKNQVKQTPEFSQVHNKGISADDSHIMSLPEDLPDKHPPEGYKTQKKNLKDLGHVSAAKLMLQD